MISAKKVGASQITSFIRDPSSHHEVFNAQNRVTSSQQMACSKVELSQDDKSLYV